MSEKKLSLFVVLGKVHNPELNMLLTYGGTSGGLSDLREFVAAFDSQDAVERIWLAMEEKYQKYLDDCRNPKTNPFTGRPFDVFHPGRPQERERWGAAEITLPGYEIEVREIK